MSSSAVDSRASSLHGLAKDDGVKLEGAINRLMAAVLREDADPEPNDWVTVRTEDVRAAAQALQSALERERVLREALEPFAAAATRREAVSSRSLPNTTDARVELGWLRRARSSLKGEG